MLIARSVKNNDHIIVEEFIINRIDVGLLTETWLKATPRDQALINQSDLKQSTFKIQHNWPSNKKGEK